MATMLEENINLADYVSWKTSGVAKQFYTVTSLAELQNFLSALPSTEPLLWLGLGSNLLIRSAGFDGTVIFTQKGLRGLTQLSQTQIRAEAGVACPTLARFAAKHALSSAEWFSGIPGTVGGALAMNAGAFGGETWDCVHSVEMINRSGELIIRHPSDFQIAYREVQGPQDEWFIAATFEFKRGDKKLSLAKINEFLDKRAITQPTGVPTCGSVFRNPPGDYAARLIEACELKGYEHRGAKVSEKHANFIENMGSADPQAIEELIDYIAEQVRVKHGIDLIREVKIV